jgi:hypothetical protein
MKRIALFCLLTLCVLGGLAMPVFAYDMKPVAFIVIDKTGEVNNEIFRDWKQQVRQGYHVPYYYIVDNTLPTQIANKIIMVNGQNTAKLEPSTLRKIAEEANVKVVTLMVIKQMQELPLRDSGFMSPWHDEDDLTRVFTAADLYVYKLDENKTVMKFLQSVVTENSALITPARMVIKYEMRQLVNTMEKRPQI